MTLAPIFLNQNYFRQKYLDSCSFVNCPNNIIIIIIIITSITEFVSGEFGDQIAGGILTQWTSGLRARLDSKLMRQETSTEKLQHSATLATHLTRLAERN